MKSLTGIIIAMPTEARAVLGRRQWRYLDGQLVRKIQPGEWQPNICLCSGVGPARAEAACQWLIAQGVTDLVLLGVAGGLHPDLRPGDLVVADAAVDVDEEGVGCVVLSDRDQARQIYTALAFAGLKIRLGRIVTVSRPVRSSAEKANLYKRYRALTVDMESAAVLRTARAAGVPVRILRAVCDPADQCLPEAVARGVAANGRRRPGYIARKLLTDPSLLLPLWRANKEMGAALKSLKRAWQAQARAEAIPGGQAVA
ncbi:MAG: phosphorylase [Deltaproteobacteria bacterium]|jgi:adenosylhomocysteine nucleosidase